jgi:hypothetical protein
MGLGALRHSRCDLRSSIGQDGKAPTAHFAGRADANVLPGPAQEVVKRLAPMRHLIGKIGDGALRVKILDVGIVPQRSLVRERLAGPGLWHHQALVFAIACMFRRDKIGERQHKAQIIRITGSHTTGRRFTRFDQAAIELMRGNDDRGLLAVQAIPGPGG